jgi:hypothetical protein
MFVGHFGIAQFGKGIRRDLPFLLLLLAAYLPDVVRVLLAETTPRFEVWSHSLEIVLAMSLAVATLWLLRGGRLAAAGTLALACALHWPADVFTGCKPTTLDGHWVGLISYRRPVNDLLLEGAVFVGGWVFARRRGFAIGKKWLFIGFACQVGFLVSLYWNSQFLIGSHEWMWKPDESWIPRSHVLEGTPCRAPEIYR